MSDYRANYESALTYRKVGYFDKSNESLQLAFDQIPAEDKVRENRDCVKIYRLIIKTQLEKKNYETVMELLNEAMLIDEQDPDFLFFKLMFLLDSGVYNEMFPLLVNYLLAIELNKQGFQDCEYGSDKAIEEVINTILPLSVSHLQDVDELESVVQKLSETVPSSCIDKLIVSLRKYKKAS